MFLILLIIAILGLLAYLDTRKPKNFPPGPRWWPIFGSALEVARIQKKSRHFVMAAREIAQQYGPVIGLKIGKEPIVVINGTQNLREFSQSDDLSGRPLGEFYDMRTWRKRRGILLVDGEFWQEQRRYILRQLREFGFGRKNMSSLIEEEVNELVEYILETINNNDSVIFNIDTLFDIHILNTLWKMLSGVRYNKEDKKMKELQTIMTQLFITISMIGTTFSHFPLLKYLAPDASGYNRYIKFHKEAWTFFSKELEYQKRTHNPKEPRGLIDIYLNALSSSEKVDNSFSEQQILAIYLDMFQAGSETTSNTLVLCFAYLLLYPDVQKKAQEEIDRVVGKNRTPSLDDRSSMPYMECVVLEALRMFSGRALTLPHRAVRDTYFGGYLIPKDMMVIGSLHSTMLAPDCEFEEPEIFKPERYMKDGKIIVPEGHLPFGFGKHRCLGESLARANIFLFVSTLLQKFNFHNTVPDQPATTEWSDGITPIPKPFKAKIVRRRI